MFAVPDPKRLYAQIRPALGNGSSVLIVLHVAMTFLRLVSNLILTRLLAPEVYGVVGIVTAVSYILTMVSDMGLRAYVTRHPHADDKMMQTVWTLRLVRNAILATIMFLGAGLFARLYSAPEVTTAIRVASLLFMLDGFSSLSLLMGERELRVIRLSVINFAKFIIVTLITIIFAAILRNYWAIIIAMFASSVFSIYASYRLVPGAPPGLRFDRESAIDLWKFSRYVIPSSIISIVLTQTDKFFLANFFPLAELGKFMLATTISLAIWGLMQEYAMRVFYPTFARANRNAPETARDVYYGARRTITLLLALGIGGVIGGGELIFRVLFNDLYLGGGLYLSILCLQPLARLITFPAEQAVIAKGFIKLSLIANLIRLAWVFTAGPIAYYQLGPFAVVVVMSLAELVLIPFFWFQQVRYGIFKLNEELYIFLAAAIGLSLGYGGQTLITSLIDAGYLPSF